MNWLLSGRQRWVAAASACCMAIIAAVFMPVQPPETSVSIPRAPFAGLSAELASVTAREDYGTLLASLRWGDIRPRPRKPEKPTVPDPGSVPGINPELLKMNYVGLIAVQDQRIVLLKVPGVGIVRYVAGDTLPDGRVLVSVTDNSLTLKAEGLPEEELTLFPSGSDEGRKPGGTEPREHGPEASK